jgi:iron complex outermembrane receptor protein
MRSVIVLSAILLAGASFAPLPARAQSASDSDAIGGIETVTVTARRRAEDLEKVPVAVTVISAEKLRTSEIKSPLDLQNYAPSLTVSGSLGSRDDDVFTIRGQSQPFGGADPGVQTYFADVPFSPNGHGSDYDLASIQILNGPQGTLFGRSTTGGAVLFEPKRPDDQFGGYIDVTGGTYALKQFQGALNVPVSDTLNIRLAGDIGKQRGFTSDVSNGENLDNVNYQAGRIGIDWHPVNGLDNYVMAYYLHDWNNGTGAKLSGIGSEARLVGVAEKFGLPEAEATSLVGIYYALFQSALAEQHALGPRATTSSIPLFYRHDAWNVTDIASYDITPGLTIKNIFAWLDDKAQPSFDYDGSDLPILAISNSRTWETQSVQVTEELQLLGQMGNFNWIAGFYHELDRPGGYSEIERSVFGGAGVLPPLSSTVIERLTNGGTSDAGYGSATYDASGWVHGLSFTAGGRYTWDHKIATAVICAEPPATSCPFPLPSATFGLPKLTQNFRAPSWTLAANWQATDDTLLYATYRRGYKSGGFNSGAEGTGLELFKPEYLTDVELGTKNNWTILGVPGRTNFDLYYGWYQDIQKNDLVLVATTIPPVPPSTTPTTSSLLDAVTFNAARASVKGLEFSSTFIPNENVEVDVFYSYTDASYDKFVLPDTIVNGVPMDILDHSGNPFAYTPKNKWGLTGRFHIPVDPSWGTPVATIQWYGQSRVYFTDFADENPDAFQGRYGLINMRLDWDNVAGSAFDAAIYSTNILNKTYKVGANALEQEIATTASIYGAPRMIGVELRWRFGEDAQQEKQ